MKCPNCGYEISAFEFLQTTSIVRKYAEKLDEILAEFHPDADVEKVREGNVWRVWPKPRP